MHIHEFGTSHPDILLMFHGSCMNWDMYKDSIEQLSQHFHVVIPALPGHDLESTEDFISVEKTTEEIEKWLLKREYKKIFGLYGLSMGGSLALRFLANNRISVNKAVIDAGITPYQLPYLLTRFIVVRDYMMIQLGRSSQKILALAFPPEKYTKEGVGYMHRIMRHMSSKTIWRVFDSCNNYAMPSPIPIIQTNVAYWYAEKEKKARKWDIDYVKKIYPQTKFRELPGLDYGEYCMMYPQKFAKDIIEYLSIINDN